MLVPRFVLNKSCSIFANYHRDPLRRNRGKRGLEFTGPSFKKKVSLRYRSAMPRGQVE